MIARIIKASLLGIVFLLLASYVLPSPTTHWLGDQVDQIQNAASLLHGNFRYLYGPYMSATSPPVATFGPFGGIIFGLPVVAGLTPDVGHIYLQFILWSALAAFLLAVWETLGFLSAVLALSMMLSSDAWWWNVSIYWSNVLILAWCLIHAAFFVHSGRRSHVGDRWWHLGFFLFGIQIHIVYMCLLPVLVLGLIKYRRSWRDAFTDLRHNKSQMIFLGLGVLPYITAELKFDFQNTKAILAHLGQSGGRSHGEGVQSFWQVLGFYSEVLKRALLSFLGDKANGWFSFAIIAVIMTLILTISMVRYLKTHERRFTLELMFLAPLTGLWHAVFFYKMNRPIQGMHYLSMGLPIAVLWLVAGVAQLKNFNKYLSWVVTVWLLLGLWEKAIPVAARFREETAWTWQTISKSLGDVCTDASNQSVDIFEGGPFLTYSGDHDPVMRFTLLKWDFGCRVDSSASTLIHPSYSQKLPDDLNHRGGAWDLSGTVAPAIGVYRQRIK